MTSGAKAQTGKTGSGSGITQLTGDATAGPGTGSQVLTLQDTSNVTSVVQTILSNNNLSLYENNAITAGISTPTPLPAQYNVVSATANYQKVILPNTITLGEYVYIDNASSYILSVYPYGTQTIDALGAGLPIQLDPSSYWLGVVEATGASGTWASVIGSLNGTSPISVTYGNGTVTTALTGIVPVANGGTASAYGVTPQQQAFALGGASNVAETFPRLIAGNANTYTIPHFQAVYLYAGQVVNSVKFSTGLTAGSALTSQWIGLFDSTGLCVSIGTQSLTTMAANTLFTWSLSSAYTVPTSGLYYVGIGIYGTTSPVYPTFVAGPVGSGGGSTIWGQSPVLQYTSGSAATVPTVGTTTFTPVISTTNGIYSSLQ